MSTPNTPSFPPLRWRKSSRSSNNGACVEVAPITDPRQLEWIKSSRGANNGTCVEVASTGQAIAVRDSKDPDGGILVFGVPQWSEFLDGVRAGEFDLP